MGATVCAVMRLFFFFNTKGHPVLCEQPAACCGWYILGWGRGGVWTPAPSPSSGVPLPSLYRMGGCRAPHSHTMTGRDILSGDRVGLTSPLPTG